MSALDETIPLSMPGRLSSSAAILARGIDHRTELAGLELVEARNQVVAISGLFLLGAVAALLTGFAINFFVAALWWDTPHRLLAVGLLVLVQAVLATTAILVCIKRARCWRPLALTVDQLKKDSICLRDLLTSTHR